MNGKSQVQTQIFVYILALVVISLVLLYGYNSIKGFVDRSDQVNLVQFKTTFANAVEMQSHEYKSVIRKQMMLPRGYNALIIVNLAEEAPGPPDNLSAVYPLVYDSWEGKVNKNIFLVGKDNMESFFAGDLYFDAGGDQYVVIEAPDRTVELKLTGMGSSTMIEEWVG